MTKYGTCEEPSFETYVVNNFCVTQLQNLEGGLHHYYYLVDGERRFNFDSPTFTFEDSQIMNSITIQGIILNLLFSVESAINKNQNKNFSCDYYCDSSYCYSPSSNSLKLSPSSPSPLSPPQTTTMTTTTTTMMREAANSWEAQAEQLQWKDKKCLKKKSVKRVHFGDCPVFSQHQVLHE